MTNANPSPLSATRTSHEIILELDAAINPEHLRTLADELTRVMIEEERAKARNALGFGATST